MKSWFCKIIPGLILFSLMGNSTWAQGRIATIDFQKVFDKYWKREQAYTLLKDEAAGIDKEDKGMLDDWNKAKDEYQKLLTRASDQAVSAEERDRHKGDAEKKLLDIKGIEQSIQSFRNSATTRMEEKKKRMDSNLLTEIRAVISAKAKTDGYAMVLNTAAETLTMPATAITITSPVVYSNGENDLTDAVLAQINANAPAASDKK